jgi:hypothetical protein
MSSGSYHDQGLGRAGWDPEDRCALRGEHGGGCDPRPEPERFQVLFRALDAGLEGEDLEQAMEYTPRTTGARA